MPAQTSEFTLLSDEALVAAVARLAQCERSATASLVASLAEFDQRRLYLPEGLPSLFAYCTQRLHSPSTPLITGSKRRGPRDASQ